MAELLAKRLDWDYEEGDELHPQSNIDKMQAGHPLTDEDRWPWLEEVADWIDKQLDAGRNGVITCSALKRSYRDLLNRRGSGVVFVNLTAAPELIWERLRERHGHFMPTKLLKSQLADREEPAVDEPSVKIDVAPLPAKIVDTIIDELGLGFPAGTD